MVEASKLLMKYLSHPVSKYLVSRNSCAVEVRATIVC